MIDVKYMVMFIPSVALVALGALTAFNLFERQIENWGSPLFFVVAAIYTLSLLLFDKRLKRK